MMYGLVSLFALCFWLGFASRIVSLGSIVPYLVVSALTIGATYFCIALVPPPEWYVMILIVLSGVILGFLSIFIAQKAHVKLPISWTRAAHAKIVMDFRLYSAFAGLIAAYILTFYFANKGINEKPHDFWFEFYVAWISGLLLFTVVGLVMGLVSLYKPEDDVFEARVKILAGGRSDGSIKYLSQELKKIGFAAKHATRYIVLEDYDDKRKAFKLRVTHKAILENIYRDVAAEANGSVTLTPDSFDPPFENIGHMLSLKVDEVAFIDSPVPFQAEGYTKTWSKSIPEDGAVTLEYEYICWHSGNQKHNYKPVRFTASLDATFKVRHKFQDKIVCIKRVDGQLKPGINLRYDEEYSLAKVSDLAPKEVAYSFQIELIEPPPS